MLLTLAYLSRCALTTAVLLITTCTGASPSSTSIEAGELTSCKPKYHKVFNSVGYYYQPNISEAQICRNHIETVFQAILNSRKVEHVLTSAVAGKSF